MQDLLSKRLYGYMMQNNPEVILMLQEENELYDYIRLRIASVAPLIRGLRDQGKPLHTIETICMEQLTSPLRPSKYHYIKGVLEAEFQEAYQEWDHDEVLMYEVINILSNCQPVFDEFGFSIDMIDNPSIHDAIRERIQEYLAYQIK